YKKCLENDVQLITIFSQEWETRQKQIKNFLKAKIGLCNKIYARNCELIELNYNEAKNFIDENHIQSLNQPQLKYYGLITDKLVAVMTFGLHPRGNSGLVLSRYCSLND